MNFAQYSDNRFDEVKPLYPTDPFGEKLDAVIWLKSMRSPDTLKAIDRIRREANKSDAGIGQEIKIDIDICSVAIDRISGFKISDEDNTFGFQVENGEVVSNAENIKLLMKNFVFLRRQVALKSNDDSFFYRSTHSESK